MLLRSCFDLCCMLLLLCFVVFFKQKTAYEMRISDWSSDVCSSDLMRGVFRPAAVAGLVLLTASSAAADDRPKWGASLDFEGKAGTRRNLGEADLFVPLGPDDRPMHFANARLRLADGNSTQVNLGR